LLTFLNKPLSRLIPHRIVKPHTSTVVSYTRNINTKQRLSLEGCEKFRPTVRQTHEFSLTLGMSTDRHGLELYEIYRDVLKFCFYPLRFIQFEIATHWADRTEVWSPVFSATSNPQNKRVSTKVSIDDIK
jgi:hypothetical protein